MIVIVKKLPRCHAVPHLAKKPATLVSANLGSTSTKLMIAIAKTKI
jgi:hypothetical protein